MFFHNVASKIGVSPYVFNLGIPRFPSFISSEQGMYNLYAAFPFD
jgi:hypothetical protein